MTESRLPYTVAEVDQPLGETGNNEAGIPRVPDYGVFSVFNFTGVTSVMTSRRDVKCQYVTVRCDQTFQAQLGESVDTNGSLPGAANQGVLFPCQGFSEVSVLPSASARVTIVWHDDPIRIWG